MKDRRDQFSALFWLGISVFVCIQSIQSEIGTFRVPGPGFLPFWAALILGTFSIVLLATKGFRQSPKGKMRDQWKDAEWRKVVWVIVVLFLYLLVLPKAGYLIATFGLMAFLLCIIERTKLLTQGISALVISLVSYVIFFLLLDIKLPKGIVGF